MKFGKVDNPEEIDFTIPEDHEGTESVLKKSKKKKILRLTLVVRNGIKKI